MSKVAKGVRAIVEDTCFNFFITGAIVESIGEDDEHTGHPVFKGQARDYPYDEIYQAMEPEDYKEINLNHTREILEGSAWRVLPLDALPEDKFVADMVFHSLDTKMFPGHTVAHGFIHNDSRGIFNDGDPVRTSTVARVFSVDGTQYIETRNTIYKIIG